MGGMKRWWCVSVVAVAAAPACGASSPAPEPAGPAAVDSPKRGLAVTFAYGTTEGGLFASSTTRGKPTVVAFVTTFDLASQVQVRELDKVIRRQSPRPNVAAVVLEPPSYGVLADAFRTSMDLSFPVAMGGRASGGRDGPFGQIDHVPTVVVLDSEGVEVWRKRGLASPRELEQALAAAAR